MSGETNNQEKKDEQAAPAGSDRDQRLENIIGGELDDEIESLDMSNFEMPVRSSVEEIKVQIETNLDLQTLGHSDLREKDNLINKISNSLSGIYKIEQGPRFGFTDINQQSRNLTDDLTGYIERISRKEKVEVKLLQKLVRAIIDSTGPNMDTTQLLLGIQGKGDNYLAVHSMDVCLLAVGLGIELTKIMEEKLKTKKVTGDFKTLRMCSQKMFSYEDLIDIGLAALLHDINLQVNFPELSPETRFDLKERSKVEKHPVEAYHFLKQQYPNWELDLHRAIYQHHEYMDGSGSPNGTEGKYMSRYSQIMSFAVFYIESISPNPFRPFAHPRKVLLDIVSNKRTRFDDDVLMAFIRSAGMFPVGSWYLLNTGEIGYTCSVDRHDPSHPTVMAVYDKSFKALGNPSRRNLKDARLKVLAEIDKRKLIEIVPDHEEKLNLIQAAETA